MGAIKPRQAVVLIYQGDDIDRLADLRNAIERAARGDALLKRMGDESGSLSEALHAYDAFLDEANERAVKITITALRGDAYRDLIAQHPPRQPVKDESREVVEEWPGDEERGFNLDTVAEPLIFATLQRSAEVARANGEEPQEFDTGDVGELSNADFNRLFADIVGLNDGSGPDPKARLSSLLTQPSSETFASPARSD